VTARFSASIGQLPPADRNSAAAREQRVGVLVKPRRAMGLEDALLGTIRLQEASAIPLGTREDVAGARRRGAIG
jgi:hypothetical protein